MRILRNSYRVARTILFSTLIAVAVIYLAAYVFISMPSVEDAIRGRAETELSKLLGGTIRIGSLDVRPFNEAALTDVSLLTPSGEECARVEKLAAGINLWKLITERRVELTFSEIIGLDGRIWQDSPDSPLNIDFIIKALSPKDKNKPPTPFDLKFHNVVIRRSALSFDKKWIPASGDPSRIDFNHIRVTDLRADIYLPRIKNDDFKVDLRRLSLRCSSFTLDKLALRAHITPRSLSVEDMVVKLPGTEIRPSDFVLEYNGYADLPQCLRRGSHELVMMDNELDPSDFMAFVPELGNFPGRYLLSLDASGNAEALHVEKFRLKNSRGEFDFSFDADVSGLAGGDDIDIRLGKLGLSTTSRFLTENIGKVANIPQTARRWIDAAGNIDLSVESTASIARDGRKVEWLAGNASVTLSSSLVSMSADMEGRWKSGNMYEGRVDVRCPEIDLSAALPDAGIGAASLGLAGEFAGRGKDIDGHANIRVPGLIYKGVGIDDFAADVVKEGDSVGLTFNVESEAASGSGDVKATIGAEKTLVANIDIGRFVPSAFGWARKYQDYALSGAIQADVHATGLSDAGGRVSLTDFSFAGGDGKSLKLKSLVAEMASEGEEKDLSIVSDWFDARLNGHFDIARIPGELKSALGRTLPAVVKGAKDWEPSDSHVALRATLKRDNPLSDFLRLPVSLLTDLPLSVEYYGAEGALEAKTEVRYLKQGTNKLIQDTRLTAALNAMGETSNVVFSTVLPAKKGDVRLSVDVKGLADDFLADIDVESVNPNSVSALRGNLSLGVSLENAPSLAQSDISLLIHESELNIGKAKWNLERGRITYADGRVDIDAIKAYHDDQFVVIRGIASPYPEDVVNISLSDFDLDYLFETLNINYVTFGGHATGEIEGRSLLSKAPIAATKSLFVKDLSYNGCVLGDADITSSWDNDIKRVGIRADIHDSVPRAVVDGGVWVTRDSLSFDLDARKVNIAFLKPFMAAFSSDVQGRASGKAKLYGTFSDIDLTGRLFADTIRMKVDYTNVYYAGSDSVIMTPGRISIPHFRLYDRYGHSALLKGEVTHRYFHDPGFNFRLSEARGLLCYDTNAAMNPDWYGTIFGNGYGSVRGWPGVVNITVDMTTVAPSHFYFVLNDTQAAADYKFLTFSDREKARRLEVSADSVPDFVTLFRRKVASQEQGRPSVFGLGIRATVTPGALMTLVMDPVGGDRINARGSGALQIDYDSESDDMLMYGKYTLDEGNYNFTLQDLILKDFTIRPGSSISFNGDPLKAILDITAAYRVNTNLSDLDKSFSTDKDLNRTNVPVDAILSVEGDMTSPEISFDIELPTLTQDVERKVKSIVSTEDMMNQQIIYLLALNRFYTPEYMGGSNGGELASVASSTISSQLVNMMGQLTDKVTLAPSIRSDKGDFSDVEVDLALSSRLLNNRLLINGNVGYRDRSTSSTTFIGDFDLEYLLSKNGNLRLKAYNHFNDQNYYLRSALTTQGIGVIYRRDFDNPFTFLKRRKRKVKAAETPAAEVPQAAGQEKDEEKER